MAVTSKALARTAAATTSATLYTVPSTSTTTVVTNALIVNTTTSSATFTMDIDTIPVASAVSLAAKSSTFMDLKQVIPADATPKTITGSASTTAVYFHISGVEIS